MQSRYNHLPFEDWEETEDDWALRIHRRWNDDAHAVVLAPGVAASHRQRHRRVGSPLHCPFSLVEPPKQHIHRWHVHELWIGQCREANRWRECWSVLNWMAGLASQCYHFIDAPCTLFVKFCAFARTQNNVKASSLQLLCTSYSTNSALLLSTVLLPHKAWERNRMGEMFQTMTSPFLFSRSISDVHLFICICWGCLLS